MEEAAEGAEAQMLPWKDVAGAQFWGPVVGGTLGGPQEKSGAEVGGL